MRVPREALLDRYASVAPDGAYSSPIPSIPQRFGTMVGGLTGGKCSSVGPSLLRQITSFFQVASDLNYRSPEYN